MDIANLIPEIAKALGVAPSTLVFLLFVLTTLCNVAARQIPQDAVGFWGVMRKVCAVIGAYVPSKLTAGVSVTDVAQAAFLTPPITQKVEAQDSASPDSRARNGNGQPATRLVHVSALQSGDRRMEFREPLELPAQANHDYPEIAALKPSETEEASIDNDAIEGEMERLWSEYRHIPDTVSWGEFLRSRGWDYIDGVWKKKEAE